MSENDINEWMNNDEDEITDDDIIKMVTNEETLEVQELNQSQVNVIPHSEGFKMLDEGLEYITE